ncbi:MAG: glycerophosphodiester phosphodiesterase family protein [Anaerolineae bacterium]|jgi:glycerophosphoryl diester phosphodiesterase
MTKIQYPTSHTLLLIHHAARRQHAHPPNSLRALRTCLDADARAVEVDISLLADGCFALLHGPLLERETTGSGPVGSHTAEQVRALRHIWQGEITEAPVGLLSEAIDLLRQHPHCVELQLDLKPDVFHSNAILSRLAADLQPVRDRVRVTSPADWALRRLRAIDPELALGFDPLLYLELDSGAAQDPTLPPFRLGAYGYWDDHPLASRRWGEAADYLAARAEALWAQAPADAIWYINARLLGQALDDGFDWIADLHSRGAQVAAWTLNTDQSAEVALARRLAALGVDRITTNDAPALRQALDGDVVF